VQTPLSDDSAGFSELELDDCATFSEEEDSAGLSELELSTFFADEDSADFTDEELTDFSELELASFSEDEDTCEEDVSPPTATGEPSVESPHATKANGTAIEPASTTANNQLERNL
jgi:hypothetical protein